MPRTANWERQIGRHLRLRDVFVFATVVKSGSMAKAAAQLGVSTPSVSEVVANLEHALAVRLLDRTPRGIHPTQYGEVLLRRGGAAFDELRQGINEIEFLSDPTVGELKMACDESLAAILSPLVSRFSQQHPQTVLDVETEHFRTFAPKLRDRSIDFALIRVRGRPDPDDSFFDDFNVEILFDDQLVIAAGAQSKWARRRKIDLAELRDAPWILTVPGVWGYSIVAEAFRLRGLDMPTIRLRTISLHLRAGMLATGDYVTALADSILRLHADRLVLKALPVDLPFRPWPVAVLTLKNRTLSPVVDRFIECAREFAASMIPRSGGRRPHRRVGASLSV